MIEPRNLLDDEWNVKICRLTSPSSQKRSNNVTARCLSERKAGDAFSVAKQREVIATDASQVFMLFD